MELKKKKWSEHDNQTWKLTGFFRQCFAYPALSHVNIAFSLCAWWHIVQSYSFWLFFPTTCRMELFQHFTHITQIHAHTRDFDNVAGGDMLGKPPPFPVEQKRQHWVGKSLFCSCISFFKFCEGPRYFCCCHRAAICPKGIKMPWKISDVFTTFLRVKKRNLCIRTTSTFTMCKTESKRYA